ncbi:hypothetical protein NEPAR06_1623 [Nematocida parisii]|uniref:Uncharacterized protein n=1 Tax=Nematocida parisii (strain ERTm3) TaxID=935791 RepID=I3EGH4_NEMP3|nr:uncharacterized protein NEPG_01184 [Nematocida parisii ERTm1]EIJ88321.1 hypothetical protein NEQG_01765 [Nematocida parisii ERTm3]KAI5127657.1 hypothetical protein NEPAR08_0964 [Nematocida parisii]EIJ93612.1 hypothetical protein NEPG_01184 [Nematocida parisii ERTm1]KAI5129504.1 hypothetical protein NEPAR03_1667 [Nematocida parisii]KAI5141214.1 hypothetical protein NEPAR04_0784 [Nematocida parisii]|eukprot:XP_013059012.1 hypothetical protein NEPG_01184 [Nematocida parisii ERTm1]
MSNNKKKQSAKIIGGIIVTIIISFLIVALFLKPSLIPLIGAFLGVKAIFDAMSSGSSK